MTRFVQDSDADVCRNLRLVADRLREEGWWTAAEVISDAVRRLEARADDAREIGDDGRPQPYPFVREYKLAGPSPQPGRRRPRVPIDGRTIVRAIPAELGTLVELQDGVLVHVTAYPVTVTRHMLSARSAAASKEGA